MPRMLGPTEVAGGGGGKTLKQEVPVGDVDGVNVTFTVSGPFEVGSTRLYLNGVRQKPGGNDYTETPGSGTLVFVAPPLSGSLLLVDFYDP